VRGQATAQGRLPIRVLDEGGDPATIAGWIADTQRERGGIAAQLGGADTGTKLSTEQVKHLVTGLRDIVTVLVEAEPADKATLYKEPGLSLAYDPDGTVNVQGSPWGVQLGVRGATRTISPRVPLTGSFRVAA
jgi:hypothetical protein